MNRDHAEEYTQALGQIGRSARQLEASGMRPGAIASHIGISQSRLNRGYLVDAAKRMHQPVVDKPHADTTRRQSVYVIQAGDDGPVKIGIAFDIRGRVANLQSSHHERLHVLKVFPGAGAEFERTLHRRLDAFRLRGEWFAWNETVREVVDAS